MANTLLTNSILTREALRLFRNSNSLLRNINTEYDDQFARSGGKIGSTLNIRIPNDYTTRTGATASIQNTTELSTALTITTQLGVDMGFSSADLALSLDDFNKRILAPAVNKLAGGVSAAIMTMIDKGSTVGTDAGAQNLTHTVDGSNNTITPTATTWLQANAILDQRSAPRDGSQRIAVLDPMTQARTVSGLAGFYNPQPTISAQTKTGLMSNILGLDWYMDQTIPTHTTGTFSAGTVNGATQTGSTLVTNAITGTLTQGDVITIAGVNAINRVSDLSTGTPQQFVVTANVATGATSIPISPPITPFAGGLAVQYQTVDNSPANGAVITLATKASEIYRNNIVFVPEAFTMATVDLPLMGGGVVDEGRENYSGISMRMITYYTGGSDQRSTRLDVLFGGKIVRPEWVVRVPDAL